MPTSNDTRVRVLDLEKIIAQVWPGERLRVPAALRLKRRASAKISATSAPGKVGFLEKMLHGVRILTLLRPSTRPDDAPVAAVRGRSGVAISGGSRRMTVAAAPTAPAARPRAARRGTAPDRRAARRPTM